MKSIENVIGEKMAKVRQYKGALIGA